MISRRNKMVFDPGVRQEGFVLAATLWIIALLALAAAVFSSWVNDTVEASIAHQDRLLLEREFQNFKADLLYAFSTQPFSVRGLELFYINPEEKGKSPPPLDPTKLYYEQAGSYLYLDGRSYSFGDNLQVRIQDVRGLMNINMAPDQQVLRFLGNLNVPVADQDMLVATLRDYIDTDDLKRLIGAERQDYLAEGLEPPANRPLVTHWEMRNVFGWHKLERFWRDGTFENLMTVSDIAGFNPNTAPRELFGMMPGITSEVRQKILDERQASAFISTSDLQARTGTAVAGLFLFYNFLPANTLRIDAENLKHNTRWQFLLTLTPRDKVKPWSYSYHLTMPVQREDTNGAVRAASPFPSPAKYITPKGTY